MNTTLDRPTVTIADGTAVENLAPVPFEYGDPLARDRPVQFEPIRRSPLLRDDPQHRRDSMP